MTVRVGIRVVCVQCTLYTENKSDLEDDTKHGVWLSGEKSNFLYGKRVPYKGRKANVAKTIPAVDNERSTAGEVHFSETCRYEIEFNSSINFFSIERTKSKVNAPKLYSYTNDLLKFSKKILNVTTTCKIIKKILLKDYIVRYLIKMNTSPRFVLFAIPSDTRNEIWFTK